MKLTTLLILNAPQDQVDRPLTESLARSQKVWLAFPIRITYGVGEISICQPKDEFAVKQLSILIYVLIKNR